VCLRLFETATSWSKQLEALNEVGTALASEIELARLLELIARRLRALIGARLVMIALPASDGTLRVEAADGNGAGVDQEAAGRLGARSGLYVPLVAGARPIGVIVAHDKEDADPRFTDADLRLAETFAPRAAVAVDQSARVAGDALEAAATLEA
jgi:hypothetical protein